MAVGWIHDHVFLVVFAMPPLLGLVSSGLSAYLFHKEDPSILSQITPSYQLLQSANFRVTISTYYWVFCTFLPIRPLISLYSCRSSPAPAYLSLIPVLPMRLLS